MTFGLRALKAILSRPAQPPLPGQTSISVASIWDHEYEGPGTCRTDTFGQACGAHRDEHQHVPEQA